MSAIDVKLIIRFVSIVVPIQSIVIDTMAHLGPYMIIKPDHTSWLQPLARHDAAASFAAGAEIVTLVYSCPAIVVCVAMVVAVEVPVPVAAAVAAGVAAAAAPMTVRVILGGGGG